MIRPNGNDLLRAEKKDLLIKISKYASDVIKHKITVDRWTATEISVSTGIPNTRLTELKHFDKYQRPIGEKLLAIAIAGGLMSVDDLIKNVDLNENERRYVEALVIYELPEVRKLIFEILQAGADPVEPLKKYLADLK